MQRGVGGIPIRSELHGTFDLIDGCLNGQVGVVRCEKFGVIVFQFSGQNVGVGCVQMVLDGAGGGGAVTNVAVAEGTDKHFVEGGD